MDLNRIEYLVSRIEASEALAERMTALSATLAEEVNALKGELSVLKEAMLHMHSEEPAPVVADPEPAPVVADPEPAPVVAEPEPAIGPRPVTIGERFGQCMAQESLNGRFEARKHATLTQALSLNDRFRFQRELFHGSAAEMTDALTALEACTSLEEALNCLTEVSGKAEDDPVVMDFHHLLERHFA